MTDTLRSLYTWVASALLILAWLPLMAVVRLFDRDPARYHTGRLFRRLGATMTRLNPAWQITVEGTEHIGDPRRPYVLVSNHQSNADIPVVSRLPLEMKWVGKKALFDLPVLGWMMKLAGDIQVDRGDARSRAAVIIKGREYLEKRCSVIFFAEGTRSRDGRLLPFTDGAFRLAVKAQVPILPLAIEGTGSALPTRTWKFGASTPIRLRVLAPVETAGLKTADVPALRERIRTEIAAQIAAWRGVALQDVLAPAVEETANPGALPA